MKVLIVDKGTIPVTLYGGTQRVIWGLGKELNKLGHKVTYLVGAKSYCDFADIIHINKNIPIENQIPQGFDIIHFHFTPQNIENITTPYIVTIHGNPKNNSLSPNSVFVSKYHALTYGANAYVYNGLDWSEYSLPEFTANRTYFHFLGKAAWKVKNLKGSVDIIKLTKTEKLKVLGGYRLNLKMGIKFTTHPKTNFKGMVGGAKKEKLINGSKGLLFPVLWNEPFGLAIIESLYYGCPVFGTPYGSLPELINDEIGFLSTNKEELATAILNSHKYCSIKCHQHAKDHFNSKTMALNYLEKYQQAIEGNPLNSSIPKYNSTFHINKTIS